MTSRETSVLQAFRRDHMCAHALVCRRPERSHSKISTFANVYLHGGSSGDSLATSLLAWFFCDRRRTRISLKQEDLTAAALREQSDLLIRLRESRKEEEKERQKILSAKRGKIITVDVSGRNY
ncbi:hypothetical protein X777_14692 [Ooceraea biroi]|uniref:Uncharacterized protein n=1 Tax=Ooceraea biroi TaxID=2015173 RepID=A0A026WR68_OOCBI|nr:hypothetical protein X777_14692 [Ooceraea biroi]